MFVICMVNLKNFKKVKNILYNDNYHIYYDDVFLNYDTIDHLLDEERILINDNTIKGPKYLFLSLCCVINDVSLGVYYEKDNFKWTISSFNIKNVSNDMYLNIYDKKLVMSGDPSKWLICSHSLIKNEIHNVYLSCDINYNITLTDNVNEAISFHFENGSIHYIKPKLRVNFDIVNIKNGIISNIDFDHNIKDKKSVGIILAAGTSSRFMCSISKQLCYLKNLPIVCYSILAMCHLDHVIIVTNSKCYEQIKVIVKLYQNIVLLINDENYRLVSLGCGLEYIKNNFNNCTNVIVHDAARPFITSKHIDELLNMSDTYLYSQYCLKLVNGLCYGSEILNRDLYTELCTPICANFNMFYFIYVNYIKGNVVQEHIPIMTLLGVKYNLVYGDYMSLRKITYFNDLINV